MDMGSRLGGFVRRDVDGDEFSNGEMEIGLSLEEGMRWRWRWVRL